MWFSRPFDVGVRWVRLFFSFSRRVAFCVSENREACLAMEVNATVVNRALGVSYDMLGKFGTSSEEMGQIVWK